MTTNTDTIGGNAQRRLQAFIERIERLNEDKAAIAADIKEVYAELKGEGFHPKPVRQLVALRAKDRAKLQEEKALLELYAGATNNNDLV